MSRAFTLWLPALRRATAREWFIFQNPTQTSQGAEGRCRVTCICLLVCALWETFFQTSFQGTSSLVTLALAASASAQSHLPVPTRPGQIKAQAPSTCHTTEAPQFPAPTAWGQREGGQVQENWGSRGSGLKAWSGARAWLREGAGWRVGGKGPSG